MAVSYYKRFPVIRVGTSGQESALVSGVLARHDITASTNLSAVTADADGFIPEGTVSAPAGDLIEFSHSTYPGTIRFVLTSTLTSAYTQPDNFAVNFVVENLMSGTVSAAEGHLYWTDPAQPNLPAQPLGAVGLGLNRIPYNTPTAQNLRLRIVTQDTKRQLTTPDLTKANYADVSVPAIGGASAVAASVTSQIHSVLSARVAANSAQMTSADNAVSNAVSVVSNALSAEISVRVANSAQMVSADNAISNAVSVVSARVAANSAQMKSADDFLSQGISVVSQTHSADYAQARSAIITNSAQMVSADDALSNAISILSSKVSSNSVQMKSADDAVSNAISIVSQAVSVETAARIAAVNTVSNAASVISAQVATNSAQMTSANNAISNAVSILSSKVSTNSAQMTSADNAISNAVSVVSQALSVETANRISAANVMSQGISVVSQALSVETLTRKAYSFPPSYQRMLILGNSMTLYSNDDLTSAQWGHITDRGMAASKQSRDFVHVLRDLMRTYSPNMTFLAHYCRDWEDAHHTFTYSTYDSLFSTLPDIIVIRLGENVSTGDLSTYQADFQALINYCKGKAPCAKIVVTGNFWSGDITSKDSYQKAAADATNCQFISFEYLDSSDTEHVSGDIVYDMSGNPLTLTDGTILHHPNDNGMNAQAVAIYDGIHKIADFQPGYFLDTGRTTGGVVNSYNDDSKLAYSGSLGSVVLSVTTSAIAQPPPAAIWNTQRYADQQYRLPFLVPNAMYTVELFTAENSFTSAGARTFSVGINGVTGQTIVGPTLTSTVFDAYVQAGNAQNKGVAAVVSAQATPGGYITVNVGTGNNGQIMGLRTIKV